MAEPIQLPAPLQQIVDANLGYYRALGRVTAEYVKALGQVWTEAAAAAIPGLTGTTGMAARAPAWPVPEPAAAARGAFAPPPPPATPVAPPALVLEAEFGQAAQAVFMVNNALPRAVSATVEVSDFTAPDGRRFRPTLRVQPGTVTLEPGGRTLVQITAIVDESLVPGIGYRGAVSVPGLSDTPVPLVLRRKLGAAPPAPADASPGAAAPGAGVAGKAKRRRRGTGAKRGKPA